MAAFQDTKEFTEQKVLVHLLTEIEKNPSLTQRSLAADLGIALGLMNQYLKRCITKGWIRASQVSPKRITYFLTAEGFTEKSKMVASYLARSLAFFRDSKLQCEQVFVVCKSRNWLNIALIGEGDLADIAKLVAIGMNLNVQIIDMQADIHKFDAFLITDVMHPQATYDKLKKVIAHDRLFTLQVLHVFRDDEIK